MSNQPYPGDVLETALNFGVEHAAIKHGLRKECVAVLVQRFKDEIEDNPVCPCKQVNHTMMCFMCIMPMERIKL